MRSWIKETIKDTGVAYLSFTAKPAPRTIVFPYVYDKGRLRGTLSVIHADLINQLKKYPFVSVLISQEDRVVAMRGKINVLENNLDETWRKYESSMEYFDPENDFPEIKSIPHYWKRVVLDFVPSLIEAEVGNETYSYEMEILT